MKDGEDIAMLSFKNIDIVGKKKERAFNEASKLFNNVFGGFAMASIEQFNEVHDMISETPYYKHEVKRAMKKTQALFDLYSKRVQVAFAEKYILYADYALRHYNQAAGDAEKIFFCIKQVLDKYRQPDSALRARMMTAREIIKQSALFHRSFWRRASEVSGFHDIGRFFTYADFTPMLRAFTVATDRVCTTDDGTDIRLGDDRQCNLALTAFIYRLGDVDRMNDAASEALAMNDDNPAYADIIKHEREIQRQYQEEEERQREAEERREAEKRQREEDEGRHDMAARLAEKYKVRAAAEPRHAEKETVKNQKQ